MRIFNSWSLLFLCGINLKEPNTIWVSSRESLNIVTLQRSALTALSACSSRFFVRTIIQNFLRENVPSIFIFKIHYFINTGSNYFREMSLSIYQLNNTPIEYNCLSPFFLNKIMLFPYTIITLWKSNCY